MAYDINKLRQQAIFSQIPDMSGGTMDMGGYGMSPDFMSPMMNQQQPWNPMIPQPSPTFPAAATTAEVPEVPTYARTPKGPPDIDTGQGGLSSRDLDIMRIVNENYTPATKSRDRFDNLLDNMPERNKPSWARKLVAGGIGMGSQNPIEDMEKVMYAPYLRDMETFKAKTGPFAQAMQAENTANINERQLTGNLVTANVNARRYEMQNEAATERNRINRIKAEMGPGWTMNARGPTVIAQNRATGQVIDTKMPTGWMTEADKIDAEGEWRVEAAKARGEAAVKVAEAGGWEEFQYPDGTTVRWNTRTGQKVVYPPGSSTPAPAGTGTPESPMNRIGTPSTTRTNTLEANRIKNEKLAEAYQTDPTVKQYIKSLGNGKYDFAPRPVVQPDTWWPGDQTVTQQDVDNYDAFRSSIDPGYKPPKTTAPIKQEAPAPSKQGQGQVQGNTVEDPVQPGRRIRVPPPTKEGVQPIVAYSPSRKGYGISYDGGKTFRPYTPTFIGQ